MNKFKSKKGFTLAELLIVVAIIAVLVAIAVPLFVGALSKAEEATFDANQRSLKAAAVSYILLNDVDISKADGTTNVIVATGTFSEDGKDLTDVDVKVEATTTAEGKVTNLAAWKAKKTEIVVIVPVLDVIKAA